MSDELPPSFSFSGKWSQRLNVLVGISSLLAIVVMLNYLSARHYTRQHVRTSDRTELTQITRRVLAGLTNEVKIICYFSKEETLYGDVRELLLEYRAACKQVSIELVDPLREPGSAQLILAKYSMSANEKAFVLFESKGRTKVVRQNELFEYDLKPLMSGTTKEVKRKDFRGELLFTSAIYYLASQKSLKAYFLMGIGGPSPKDQEKEHGYSVFAGLLQANGVDWATLNLVEGQAIPEDCSLLLVVGPQQQLPSGAMDAIQKYLENGGRAMILFDVFGLRRETGFEALVKKFGVKVGFDNVKDPQSQTYAGGRDLVISDFGSHPITAPLAASESFRVHVMLPRSIQPIPKNAGAPDLVHVEPLFTTGPMATLHEPPNLRTSDGESARLSEVRTNYPLAVAVERGGLSGVDAARAGTSRLVITGDSIFLNNGMIGSAANPQFAGNAINWLLDRSMLLSDIGVQSYHEFHLTLNQRERTLLSVVFLAAMPGAALAFGFLVWLRRRS